MNPGTVPPQAIQPLRERLAHLRSQPETAQLLAAIRETEALIQRLENLSVPRHP